MTFGVCSAILGHREFIYSSFGFNITLMVSSLSTRRDTVTLWVSHWLWYVEFFHTSKFEIGGKQVTCPSAKYQLIPSQHLLTYTCHMVFDIRALLLIIEACFPDARRVAPISARVFCNKTSLIFDVDFEHTTCKGATALTRGKPRVPLCLPWAIEFIGARLS